MISLLEDLRSQLTTTQRAILTACWKHYRENGQWIDFRLLYFEQGGQPIVRPAIQKLGGSIIYEQGDSTTTRYVLTILGAFLSEEGEQCEQLLTQYLGFLVKLATKEPLRDYVNSQEVSAALALTQKQSTVLGYLISLSSFAPRGGGGYDTPEWSFSTIPNIGMFPADLLTYVQTQVAQTYDPNVPTDDMARGEYYRDQMLAKQAAKNRNAPLSAETIVEEVKEPMNIDENLLFEGDLFNLQNEYRQLMSKELQEYDKDYILSVDIDEACSYLVDKFGLDIPVLSDDYEVLDPIDTTVSLKQIVASLLVTGIRMLVV
jgi:hypothetical protein